ncbi:ATP-binding protein [Neobacillus sp. PS3-34]|uniref:ATP-binding protein n=1 Tax=Neobacillus sp. PS3-34 TaxID=3070678 RepID=UPI0027E0B94D|nr:ATP-binding protein [Neobacillus sp. PS3-34]WML46616.1 ATP-binding protein [Neobacillus sp. PS3-34]
MKFKSIFPQLLVYYIGTTLIGFCLLAILLNFSLQELLLDRKESFLNQQAEKIVETLQENNDNPSLGNLIKNNKHFYNIRTDILLINQNETFKKINKRKNKLLRKNDIKDPKILEQVLKGERIRLVGPFEKSSNEMLLTVGVPIKQQNHIIGGLFLHTPVQEIPTTEVSRLVFLISLIIAVPTTGVLYLLSRRFSTPLLQMNHAAKLIGQGDFKERIRVERTDEVGQLATTFNEMADQLGKLEDMRKDLIANVSHELRTPLTSVRGFIQGMMEGVIPPDRHKQYLDICHRELFRLNSLLTTMLDLAAIESGRITLQPMEIRIDSVISSVSDSVNVRMIEKNIIFSVVHEHEPPKILGDPERLKQIIFNLLDNAIRHTPEYGTISVAARLINSELELKISDTGVGIAPEMLPHIWERFYTGDPSRMSHRERSGLGLTITKHLVEIMGGRISVDSAVGKGTTFTVYLPFTS